VAGHGGGEGEDGGFHIGVGLSGSERGCGGDFDCGCDLLDFGVGGEEGK
jgi:hypothetical protein